MKKHLALKILYYRSWEIFIQKFAKNIFGSKMFKNSTDRDVKHKPDEQVYFTHCAIFLS